MGVSATTGLLLFGASGTGKTHMAHALAHELKQHCIDVSASSILGQYLGESEQAVRQLFAAARRAAPCTLIFDDIETLAPKRAAAHDDVASSVGARVLSTMLNEMDGVSEKGGVFVVGCTSNISLVDDAVLRPGRMDATIEVAMPTTHDRQLILESIAQHMAFGGLLDFGALAAKTSGLSAAQCRALLQEAAVVALRRDPSADVISQAHVDDALATMRSA